MKFSKIFPANAPSADSAPGTSTTELDSIVDEYLATDIQIKELEKRKNELKAKFDELATEQVRQENNPLPVLSERFAKSDYYDRLARTPDFIKNYHPDYRFVHIKEENEAVIAFWELDPAKVAFSWTTAGGATLSRNTAVVGVNFDAESFYQKESRWRQLVDVQIVRNYSLDESRAAMWTENHPELLDDLQRYVSPGKIQLRYTAKKAKIEE